MKTTKRALFSSVMALILCFSMLVGTTFAWFTDEVKSGNNIITAGNLDIELEYWNGTKWDPVQDATELFSKNYWEPGHTEVVYLRLSNLGTLALKYQLGINITETQGINAEGKPFKLSDYIYMGVVEKVNGETGAYTKDAAGRAAAIAAATNAANISKGYTQSGTMAKGDDALYMAVVVYMPTDVDNDANYKTGTIPPAINLGINLFATQLANEYDSFGPDYDKDAVWTGNVDTAWYDDATTDFTLATAEQLAGLAELVNDGNSFEGKTINLGANVDLNNMHWTPIGTSASPFKGSFIGTGYTISNLKAVGTKRVGLFGATSVGAHIEGVTVVNANVSGNDYVGVIVGGGYLARNSIKNCVVENATVIATPYYDNEKGVYDGGAKAGVIVGQAYNGNITGCTVKNSTVTAYRDLGGIAGMLDFDGKAGTTVEASGNTVVNVTLNYIGVAGKYDGDKPNQNMGAIVGRVGSKAVVEDKDNTATEVTMNETNNGATMIFTLDELIAFANDVNAGNSYAGKTVILGASIDLANMEWTPIGNNTNKFQGTFDGNGYTISNLKITSGKSYVGLFGFTTDGEIKNLTVYNAKVTGYTGVGVVAGSPYTSKYTDITVSGHVEVNGMAYVGGVGGRNAYADWTDITVDVDETSYVKAVSTENGTQYRTYVGGVVGFNGEGGHTFKNITSNIDVYGDVCDIGGAFGIGHYENKFENVTVTGNVIASAEAFQVGGILGVWHNQNGTSVTLTDCEFNGKITVAGEAVTGCDFVGGAYSEGGTGELIITNYVMENGIEYALDGVSGDKTLYLVPAEYTGKTVNVAEGTVAIGNYAFAYNSNVKTVVLASTVRDLGRGFDSSSVEKVVLNEGLTTISSRAFKSTTALKEVVISSTVTEIADNAFQKSGIKEIVIPANVKTIGEAAFGSSLIEKVTFEGDIAIQGYAFRGCTKLRTVVMNGYDVTFVASTLNGRNSCWFCNGESNNPNTSNITFYVKNAEIKNRVLTAMGAEKNNTPVVVEQTTAEGGYYVDANGNATAYKAPALDAALNDGKNVVLAGNLKFSSSDTTANSGYGATGVSVMGGILDGNGHSLGINNWGTWDSAINITAGTIKNLTVNSGMRGIFINHNGTAGKVYLENVVIDGTVYTISCDQGTNSGLEAKNSTFNGWTSYAATIGDVKFVDCSFGKGQGYAFCRPYAPTEFVGCDFAAGYELDAVAAVTFENCTIGGVALTAENLATLVTSNIGNATVK